MESLDAILQAYSRDDLPAFRDGVSRFWDEANCGAPLSGMLLEFAETLRRILKSSPVARGVLCPEWGGELFVPFKVYIRPEGALAMNLGDDPDADRRGDIGASEVYLDSTPDDIRRAIIAAFGEATESAFITMEFNGNWR
jgi:hypothetical protein